MLLASTVTLGGAVGAVAATLVLLGIAVGAVAAYRDMERRGRAGINYAVLMWLAWPIGLIAWVWGRGRYPEVLDH